MVKDTIHIFSPAKINLYLHVTGRLDNGYHALDSLVAFADIGDDVVITPAPDFSFHVDGAFARSFDRKELDASPSSSNIAVKAAWEMSRAAQKPLDLSLHLTKNLPLAGGIGGGSANAAAVIWGLLKYWDISPDEDFLLPLMTRLGADVPVCLRCEAVRMGGLGDILEDAPKMDEICAVLVHPGVSCPTPQIFAHYDCNFSARMDMADDLKRFDDLIEFLKQRGNDLYEPACAMVTEIKEVIEQIEEKEHCALARMSGSGSTCFGLFKSQDQAIRAAKNLAQNNPSWWVKSATLNRPVRY